MPKPIPNTPRENKAAPEDDIKVVVTPKETPPPDETPAETPKVEETPVESPQLEETPVESPPVETIPEPSPEKTEMPSNFNEENCVEIDGQKIELKPTKLKYFRNKAASAYSLIKAVPLPELLTYSKGVLDPDRDADQLLYDFLVSVFDNPEFVKEHYDNLDADVIDRIVKIFGRINHIDEKEEAARKNREAQAQAKR